MKRAKARAGHNARGDIKLTFLTNELTQGVDDHLAGKIVDLLNIREIDFAEASKMIKQAKTAALLKEVLCEALGHKSHAECVAEFPDLLSLEKFSLTLQSVGKWKKRGAKVRKQLNKAANPTERLAIIRNNCPEAAKVLIDSCLQQRNAGKEDDDVAGFIKFAHPAFPEPLMYNIITDDAMSFQVQIPTKPYRVIGWSYPYGVKMYKEDTKVYTGPQMATHIRNMKVRTTADVFSFVALCEKDMQLVLKQVYYVLRAVSRACFFCVSDSCWSVPLLTLGIPFPPAQILEDECNAGRRKATNPFTVWKQGKAKKRVAKGKKPYLESTTEVGVMGHCSKNGKMGRQHFPGIDHSSMDELFRDHHRPNKYRDPQGEVSVLLIKYTQREGFPPTCTHRLALCVCGRYCVV